ncbi:hypothetical protein Tco_0859967 [Tanacetum coccineum]|uniref:Uncharacterized protein n=1 Tax=Tanacetum coccineum TaxID=301880 RepID=A0ABQ5BDK1_9ASTR
MVRLVKHGLEKFGFESIENNDKSLSESQLDHEMVDRFVEMVVRVVLECRHGKGYCVVREIDDELVEEVEAIHVGKRMMVLDIDVEEGRFEGDEDGGEV